MSKNSGDWDRFTNKIIVTDEPEEMSTVQQPSVALALVNGLLTVAILSALTALGLMIANNVLIGAWPEFTEIAPGIGFLDAFHVSWIGWLVFIFKQTVVANVMK